MRQKLLATRHTNYRFFYRSATRSSRLPPKPNAVFFDWDGTLIQFAEWKFIHSINQALIKFNIPREKHLKDLKQSRTVMDTFEQLLPPAKSLAAYQAYKEIFMELPTKEEEVADGAISLIASLRSLNLPIGIVSNLDQQLLERQIAALKFGNSFSIIKGSACKPDSAALLEALEATHLKSTKEVWYIGDSLKTDVPAALKAGLTPIYIGKENEQSIQPPPYFTIPNLTAVNQIITNLHQQGRSR
jgi:HAD superfamily hydrolase (TIGR01549 family)